VSAIDNVSENRCPTGEDWQPIVYSGWETLIPSRRFWVGPQDPVVHFFRWPWEYRAYLTILCGLREDSSVLELGCNHGRTALGLLGYLKPPGRYEGLDIMPDQIAFAQRAIQSAYPHFNFTLADIRNGVYNPGGKCDAAAFRFPYRDETFDVVYAASLYTHLLPPVVENYFQECQRVLRKGGRCLFSFFVLDFYKGKGTSTCELYEFNHQLAGRNDVAVHNPEVPEQVIAYSRSFITRSASVAGLTMERILSGIWSLSGPLQVNEQDLVVLAKDG
jgi:SAM-dependent methyltransferase